MQDLEWRIRSGGKGKCELGKKEVKRLSRELSNLETERRAAEETGKAEDGVNLEGEKREKEVEEKDLSITKVEENKGRDTGNAARRTWKGLEEAPGPIDQGYQRHVGGRRDPLKH